ncbi:MAG: choice-of-anchor Q domain-containing protein [Bacteroidota bacterium]
MKQLALLGLTVGILLGMWSCERPTNPVEEGTLSFNVDTVKFDSIFTTFLAPSERLIVRNTQNQAVKISRIWLEDSPETQFEMIIDGLQTTDTSDIVIAANDSMHIFVNHTSTLQDNFIEEFINFEIGDETQQMLIYGKVIDAYFLRARLRQSGDSLGIEGFFFDQDTTLRPGKPIVMDGPIFVTEGTTVTIEPGTEIFFTPYKFGFQDDDGVPFFALFSTLIVNGTLVAEGEPFDPIVLQGSRFDSLFLENPAQWRGVWFSSTSRDNRLRHVEIKNALFGVRVDSLSLTPNPKVDIQHCLIKNMGLFGVWGQGFDQTGATFSSAPAIRMENSIVNTCKERTVFIDGGGKYDFFNCTFANFNLFRFSRRSPQILVRNYRIVDNTGLVFPSYTRFVNSIIWGSEEDEFVIDTLIDGPFDELTLENCIVRITEENDTAVGPHLVNSLKNTDPLFADYFSKNYRILEGSPAIDAGIDVIEGSTGYIFDYRADNDSLRSSPFDIGAFEFFPQ